MPGRTTPPLHPADRLLAGGLVLDRWRPAHVPALTSAIHASRDHLEPWMPWVAAYARDPAAAVGFVDAVDRAWAEGAEWSWGVWDAQTLVGAVGLHARGDPGVLEVGYWTHVAHVRRGVATRGARVATREALSLGHVRRVEIRHAATNTSSAGVPVRLGYRRVGEVPRRRHEGGGSDVTIVWGLDADDLARPGEHLDRSSSPA